MILGHALGLPAPNTASAYLNEQGLRQERDALRVENARLRKLAEDAGNFCVASDAENARLREALTPSLETKAAYVARFEQQCPDDETVPWSNIKEIMAAILFRAGMSGEAPTRYLYRVVDGDYVGKIGIDARADTAISSDFIAIAIADEDIGMYMDTKEHFEKLGSVSDQQCVCWLSVL